MKIGLNPVDRLIRTLQGQRTVYAALLSLYQNHLGDIKEWNLVALKPVLLEEQRLMRELNLLEQRRLAAVSRLAVSQGIDPAEAKHNLAHKQILQLLTESIKGAEDRQLRTQMADQLKQLTELGNEIAADMARLTETREPLLPLLQNALNYIRRNDPEKTAGTAVYETPGRPKRRVASRNIPVIDKKV
ncbi:MAG: hypothetical protein FWE76_05705 [Symbiobacteriaceae bacterium]|nr:hypothetical protein [Symbiobacteriaceae bacterium]